MIVTADPLGDFNATSQILRYSALAREITIPRIPSVTSQILAATATSSSIGSQTYFSAHGGSGPHRNRTPTDTERETMELAALEIARMSEEIDALRSELLAETQRRMEAESHLLSFEERLNEQLYEQLYEQEMDVREECFREMEGRMALEMAKWRARWEAELDSRDEHVDRKIEILERCLNEEVGKEGSGWTTGGMEDDDKENYVPHEQVEELMDENERLRRQVAQLQRELEGNRSPSKKRSILGESRLVSSNQSFGGDDVEEEMQRLRLSGPEGKSPVKKMKKLAARKWEIVDEGEYF
jgi:ubiquinone biosynthesis protein UbiJ